MLLTPRHGRFSTPYRSAVSAFFLIAVTLFCLSLIRYASHYSMVFLITVPITLCLGLLICFFTTHPVIKYLAAVTVLLIMGIATGIHPIQQSSWQIEYYLFPICFVVLFPGSWWPIASACILLSSTLTLEHWLHSQAMFEHSLTLLSITILANFTVYYRKRLTLQMMKYRQDSLTDFLTGARNRKAFQQDLDSIQDQPEYVAMYALVVIDLDNFKRINDSLGYNAGDQLLIEIYRHLDDLCEQQDANNPTRVYRLSGDEFALILYNATAIEHATQHLIDRIHAIFDDHYQVDNNQYFVKASLGIALLKHADNNVQTWYHNADVAMYYAKESEKHKTQWFDDHLKQQTQRQHKIEKELSYALMNNQLALYYQPKVSLSDNTVAHAEALIRWQHPTLGTIFPDEFITIAEKSHQIVPIGRWVIRTACRQASEWRRQGVPIRIAVNVSTIQFLYDDICQIVQNALDEFQLPAQYLELEITETTMMTDFERVIDTCKAVRNLGITISIDDFGTVYSSLNYIKQLPIDVIKIDKSFIDDSITNETDHMIVRTIIQLGRNLNKVIIAEGVDSDAQRDMLASEQCDFYQGYLYAKPLPPDAFMARIQSTTPDDPNTEKKSR